MEIKLRSVSGKPGSRFAWSVSTAARFALVVALLAVSIAAREIHATSLAQPNLSASGARRLESMSVEGDRLQNVGPVLGEPERSARKIQHWRGDSKMPTTTSTDSSNSPQSSALYRRALVDASRPGDRSSPGGGGPPAGNG